MVHKWEATGLITHVDKNQDGLVQYLADSQLNELKVDADIMVLANPEIADLPNWVWLLAAGALAAALSTAAGLLLVISSSVSHDLIKKMIKPDVSEKGIDCRPVVCSRCCDFGCLFWHQSQVLLLQLLHWLLVYCCLVLSAIVMGIFSKRMNKERLQVWWSEYF